jgi:hypothetical protein
MKRRAVLVASALLPLLAACDPNAPDKRALASALTAELLGRPPCFATNVAFPYTRQDTVRPTDDLLRSLPELAALRDAGLIDLQLKEVGIAGNRPVVQTAATLTELGKSAFHPHLPGLMTATPGFCGGQRMLGEVQQFTMPSDSEGHRVTSVDFTYRTQSIPPWMHHPRLQGYYVSVRNMVAAEKEAASDQTLFVQTPKGWLPWNRVGAQ